MLPKRIIQIVSVRRRARLVGGRCLLCRARSSPSAAGIRLKMRSFATSSFCFWSLAQQQLPGFSFFRRRKGDKQIADGISGAEQTVNDEPVLKERMKDALATLKTASGSKSGYLYDLPWYVIIGPPGAGKTTRWSIPA